MYSNTLNKDDDNNINNEKGILKINMENNNNKNNIDNNINDSDSYSDLSFESASSIKKSNSSDSSLNNKKIMNKSSIINQVPNTLILKDDASSNTDLSENINSEKNEKKIEIPKILNYLVKNSQISLLNLNLNLHLNKKKYNDNKSLLFLKLHYNLISTYTSKGFDKKKINFQNELVELQKFKADSEQIWIAVLDVTKNYLATGGKSGVVKIWKINNISDDENKYINSPLFDIRDFSSKEEEIKSFLNLIDETAYKIYFTHTSDITDISWSKKYQNILVSVSLDNKAVLYDINKNSPLEIFTHKSALTSVCFYPNEIFLLNLFLIGQKDKSRYSLFLDEKTKKAFDEIPPPKNTDDFFITSCFDLKIYLWNTKHSKQPYYIIYVNEIITKTLFFPDGQKLCLGSAKGNIFIYNIIENFQYSYSFHVRNKRGKGSLKKKITDIKFLRRNEILVTTNDSRIRLININDGSVLQKFKGHKNLEGMLKCDFCDNYEIIVSPSEDKYVYLWNIEKNKKISIQNYEIIDIDYQKNKQKNKLNKKIHNYEYFLPKYSERKEYCTQCLFLDGQNLNNYNHKIYNNELLIYIKNIILLFTNRGNIHVMLDFNTLGEK